ncbi:hypothetical protein MERGE_000236 [Pneumocystis wakefieldiae]|uniref:Dolichol phosphate-mannose biosynthesis regulatory protein n=1 Tax=Pneumocystis wakefieldiae TaxID=38082 RepID=A0A899FQM4_9ASCO|nr:hypothetical protein MERGE_000236 [Pneumocystis wakefieldiae]
MRLRNTFCKIIGLNMLLIASIIFIYYSIWTLIMPFVNKDHPLHSFFLPREWAIRIPVILLLTCFAVVTSFIALVMIKSNSLKFKKKK